MADIETLGERRAVVTPDLALIFERVGDRWTHVLEVASAPASPRLPIARAVEWDPDRDDPLRPASPVYQELQFQRTPSGGVQALLLGSAGPHHFSAVFEVIEDSEGVAVSVEVADRARGPASTWGATYTLDLRPGDLIDASLDSVEWAVGPRRLALLAEAGTHLGLSPAGLGATRAQVVSVADALPSRARTMVCHYRWKFPRVAP